MNSSGRVCRVTIRFLVTAFALSCGRGTEARADFERMRTQQRYDSYAASEFFPDSMTMRTPPVGTLSREEAELGDSVVSGKRAGAALAKIPVSITPELVRIGLTDFNVYCATCHGERASGGGLVGSNLKPPPPALNTDDVRAISDGELFETITKGRDRMPAYGWALPPVERWAVIAYLRSLPRAAR